MRQFIDHNFWRVPGEEEEAEESKRDCCYYIVCIAPFGNIREKVSKERTLLSPSSLQHMMIPPFAHNNFVARCKKEKGRLFRKASSSFFLAFIGWMSAALMAVLCRLKGRGKKGQKRGGVHVFLLQGCRNRSSRRAAKLGKKAVFLLLLSVLSFFVEASHILLQLLLFLPP